MKSVLWRSIKGPPLPNRMPEQMERQGKNTPPRSNCRAEKQLSHVSAQDTRHSHPSGPLQTGAHLSRRFEPLLFQPDPAPAPGFPELFRATAKLALVSVSPPLSYTVVRMLSFLEQLHLRTTTTKRNWACVGVLRHDSHCGCSMREGLTLSSSPMALIQR